MAAGIERSFVPKIAVERTIQRGIELHEKVHGPVTPEIRAKIVRYVHTQANILNAKRRISDEEMSDTEILLYGADGMRAKR